jgi:hypothetical protein
LTLDALALFRDKSSSHFKTARVVLVRFHSDTSKNWLAVHAKTRRRERERQAPNRARSLLLTVMLEPERRPWGPSLRVVMAFLASKVAITSTASVAVLITENLLRVFCASGLLSVLMHSRAAASSGVGCGATSHGVAWHSARPFVIRWRHAVVGVAVLIAENLLRVFRASGLLSVLMRPTAAATSGVSCRATAGRVAWHPTRPFVIRWWHAVVCRAVLRQAQRSCACDESSGQRYRFQGGHIIPPPPGARGRSPAKERL